jgi:hypothetical protein
MEYTVTGGNLRQYFVTYTPVNCYIQKKMKII